MKEIKRLVPMYRDLAAGSYWQGELSPLNGIIADLSLSSESIVSREVITADRLLFSSGGMITRSKEIGSIAGRKTERQNKAQHEDVIR
jgi:hypothetical protein